MKKIILIFAFIALAIFANSQTTWYLDADATGTGTGTSLENACTTITAIFAKAITGGDEIMCYNGTYTDQIVYASTDDLGSELLPIKFYSGSNQDSVVFSSSQVFYKSGKGDIFLEFHGVRFIKIGTYLMRSGFYTFYNCEFTSTNNGGFTFYQLHGIRFFNCLYNSQAMIASQVKGTGYPSDNVHIEFDNSTFLGHGTTAPFFYTVGVVTWYNLVINNSYISSYGTIADYTFTLSQSGNNNYYSDLSSVSTLPDITITESSVEELDFISESLYQNKRYYLSKDSDLRGTGNLGQDSGFLGSYGLRGGN